MLTDVFYFSGELKILPLCENLSTKYASFKGENRFIESICQTIFSIDELLAIVTDENIDNNLKRPYLRFLLWVYLNTAGGMVDSGAGDIPHDQ